MRVSKPAPSTRGRSSGEVIAELENLKIVVQAQVESLALEREVGVGASGRNPRSHGA